MTRLRNALERAPKRTPSENPPKVRSRPKLGAMAIAVYLVATPAAAAEFTHRQQANGPDGITMRGEIDANDCTKFIVCR